MEAWLPSQNELTLIIFNIELTDLGSEASKYIPHYRFGPILKNKYSLC